MKRYAETTQVSTDRSIMEIKRILTRYGATNFTYGEDEAGSRAALGFIAHGRRIKYVIQLPDRNDEQFLYTPSRKWERTKEQALEAWEQACRQRWRALTLIIKAKLEAVEAGIASFEDEFLAHTMLPDGRTVAEWMEPQIEQVYLTGTMPMLLPMLGSPD
jgi:hypothetical protein